MNSGALSEICAKENVQLLLLSLFVRYVLKHICAKEELLDLVAIMDTANGVGIKNSIDSLNSGQQ